MAGSVLELKLITGMLKQIKLLLKCGHDLVFFNRIFAGFGFEPIEWTSKVCKSVRLKLGHTNLPTPQTSLLFIHILKRSCKYNAYRRIPQYNS